MQSSHAKRGFPRTLYDSNVCYHFLVGKDGTVVQNAALAERRGCTQNSVVNNAAIQVVLAGNFEHEYMTSEQLAATHTLIRRLDAIYSFEEIIPHRAASPTACPGSNLLFQLEMFWRGPEAPKTEVWRITRYYTPTHDQPYYFHGSYEEDFKINCQGDCLVPADGSRYTEADAFKVAACPKGIPFGTRFLIEGIGEVVCRDRGGAIKDKRLDVWAGIGNQALFDMKRYPGHYLRVTRL